MTRGPLGDSLYLGVIWRQVMNETPVAASIADAIRPENLSRPDSRTVPSLCPVNEGSHPDRGFRHELRCLAMDPSVARPARDSSRPVQFGPLGYFHPWLRISPRAMRPPSCHARLMTGHLLGVPVFDQPSARYHPDVGYDRAESAAHGFEMRYEWGATSQLITLFEHVLSGQRFGRLSDAHQIVADVARFVGRSRFASAPKQSD